MAMNMRAAFSSKFMTKVTLYRIAAGTYDSKNNFIEGAVTTVPNVWARLLTGNRFSQHSRGEAVHNEDGGIRKSDFRNIYIRSKYVVTVEDKVGHKGIYYNLLQRGDEEVFGFNYFEIEKSENWTP